MLRSPLGVLSIFLILLNLLIVAYVVFSTFGSPWATDAGGSGGPSFGAIARGPSSGELGYSTKVKSREEAEQAALAKCGSNCSIAVWFQDACGAYAEGGNGWGANFGTTMDEARSKAQGACAAYSSEAQCTVKLVVCSAGHVSEE